MAANVWTTRDRRGRVVTLDEERMRHIEKHHPNLTARELAIETAVEIAETRQRGNYEGAEKLYAPDLGPARFLAVVVEYDGLQGRVITAHPDNDEPTTDLL